MASGRETAEAALRPALVAAGWRARAAGWFTKELRSGVTAVIAVITASRHHVVGTGSVTIMVGLRDDRTEEIVEQLLGPQTPWYHGRTWVTPLGYVLAGASYVDAQRYFTEENAEAQADELLQLLAEAEPRLRRIADSTSELRTLTETSTAGRQAPGLARIATLIARTEGPKAASNYVSQQLTAVEDEVGSLG